MLVSPFKIAWRNRIELIQDFEFPQASNRLKATDDGQYIMGTGVYKPQIRVWELSQMAMKFERHTEAENINFEILSQDWTKSALLQNDRSVEFHSHYGMHYRTRVPKFGRDLKYHYPSCDLMIVGASHEAWRLNLEQGRFLGGFETDLPEINTLAINPAHLLFGLGGNNGKVEFWDHRMKKRIGSLDVAANIVKAIDSSLLDELPQITSLSFDIDGLTLAAGSSTGQIVTYDLRRPTPLLVKDHQYGFPIKSIFFHDSGNILSSDTKICKIWDRNHGDIFTNIETPQDINDVCVSRNSGLIMMANEGVQIQTYYIPALGPAPAWCPFLDNLTEELEENPNTAIYDDYKFVSRKELSNLGLDHLIGTAVLKAYMHGYFVDFRLYEKAKAIANPFEFQEHKKQMVQRRIEEKRQSRISAIKKLPKVNKAMAAKMVLDSDSEAEGKKKKKKAVGGTSENPLGDDRFAALFQDRDFEVDTTSHEYRIHHPSESITNRFEPIDQAEANSDDSGF